MDFQTEKIKIAQLVLGTENPEIIQSIKNLFKEIKEVDFWDKLTDNQQDEIKQATEQIELGMTTDYEEFIAKHR